MGISSRLRLNLLGCAKPTRSAPRPVGHVTQCQENLPTASSLPRLNHNPRIRGIAVYYLVERASLIQTEVSLS
jgi:hypothetical protein